jgi:chemotaxis protein methyltransferase CheR
MTEIAELAQLIEDVSGNMLPEREHHRLAELAVERVKATGHRDLESYVRLLRLDLNGAEWRHLLSSITINESFLFRAPQQFRAVAEAVIPELASRRLDSRSLNIWSTGCARGEEAATLAIICAESQHLTGWSWRVLATDVDQAALEEAQRGRFGQRAVAKVPADLLEKYFIPRGDEYELSPELQERIEFRPHNLIGSCFGMEPGSFDLVFLRNVLIYFRHEAQRRVVAAVAEVLVNDGYLFLGPSESLWQLSFELTAVDLGDCFCYRHTRAVPLQLSGPAKVESTPPAVVEQQALQTPVPAPPEQIPKPDQEAVTPPLRRRILIPIVEALVQSNIEHAQELIREATVLFPESPSLRALEGLAFDFQQLTDSALKAYRACLYLDPTLFQVRYLLARCMERLGWQDRAHREYREVLATLTSQQARNLEDWAVLGVPSRAQVEGGCTRALR